jgi:hypothetical protein
MTATTDPIFIGGLSHSGKTQLRQVLCAHPELSLTRRTRLWDRYFARFGDLGRPGNLERCLEAMARDVSLRPLQPDTARIRAEFLAGPSTYARLFGCVHGQHAERVGKRRWGDQLKFVERFADPIFETFAGARMLHLIRDPRERTRAPGLTAHGRPGATGWETAQWRCSARLAGRNQARYPDRYRIVRYETLRRDPEATLRDVCRFLGEDFVAPMAAVLTTLRFDADAHSSAPKAAIPPDLAFVERYARQVLPHLGYGAGGYGAGGRRLTAGGRARFLFFDWPINRAAMAAHDLVGYGIHRRQERG